MRFGCCGIKTRRAIARGGLFEGVRVAAARSLLGLFFFLFGQRLVRLGPLDISAFLNQLADLVGRDGQFALRTDIQCGSD
jgi:hypothetical protein